MSDDYKLDYRKMPDVIYRTRMRAKGYWKGICDHSDREIGDILDELADELEDQQTKLSRRTKALEKIRATCDDMNLHYSDVVGTSRQIAHKALSE